MSNADIKFNRLTWCASVRINPLPSPVTASHDGITHYIWIGDYKEAMTRLRAGKRLRVSMGSDVFHFYLTKSEGMPAIRCG